MRPNFLVIGAGKCGTTSLCALLDRHPQVFISKPKEPNFLAFDDVFGRGWSWYESLFSEGAHALARGEGSVAYSDVDYEQRVVERVLEYLPDIRFIYIARHPLERISSAYRELHHSAHKRGYYVPFSLREALEDRPQLIANTMYWSRISVYLSRFSRDRIQALFLEDLRKDPQQVLGRCFEFLGVEPLAQQIDAQAHLNIGREKLRDSRLTRLIRRNPRLRGLGYRLPPAMRATAKHILRRPFKGPVQWDADSREYVLARVRDDAREYLAYCGKPIDYWDLG